MEKYLHKLLGEDELPSIHAALTFTNDNVTIDIDENTELPVLTLRVGKLKDHFKKVAKGKPISLEKSREIQELIAKG